MKNGLKITHYAVSVAVLAIALLWGGNPPGSPPSSSEMGFSSFSPRGAAGGAVVPASCASGFEHFLGECGPVPEIIELLPLSAICSVSPTSANIGQDVTWSTAVLGGAGLSWNVKAAGPANSRMAYGVINDKLYIAQGSQLAVGRGRYYDPGSDTWSLISPPPAMSAAPASAVANGKLYSFETATYEYDPSVNNWATRAAPPVDLIWGQAVTVSNIIYVIKGTNNYAYDPATDIWTAKANPPTNHGNWPAVAQVDGIVYAIGGSSPPGTTVDAYDPVANTWTSKADIPVPYPPGKGYASAAAYNGKIYVFGGGGWDASTAETWEYDPSLNDWERMADMPTQRNVPAVGVINSKIYVYGGEYPGTYLSENDEFGLATRTYSWSGTDGLSGTTRTVLKSYSSVGTKTGAVTVGDGTTIVGPVACANSVEVLPIGAPTLSVSLLAYPFFGTAPLNGVDLTATVSGTAGGTINYTFYCDRLDAGVNITPGWAAKFDNTNDNPKIVVDACNYSSAGVHVPKVIVERASLAAEGRWTVNVFSSSPTADIRADGSGGSITILPNTSATITWCGSPAAPCADASSCSVSPGGWTGTSGTQSTGNLTASRTYTLTCDGPGGTSVDDVVVQVTGANQTPVAAATISKDGITYADSITVTRGVSTPVYLSASGSTDPDGWTHPTQGVASGGKCDWNSDLNQGAPTFETALVDPASPSACNIPLGTRTFNDLPGVYTYSVLRITDRPGAVSGVDTVSVKVEAPSLSPPPTVDIKINGSDGPLTFEALAGYTASWTSSNATSCFASGGAWSGSKAVPSGLESFSDVSRGTYTYTLTCSGPGGSTPDTAQVNVIQIPRGTFFPDPGSIILPQTSTLTWSIQFADSCEIDQGIGSVDPVSGNRVVMPIVTTLYTLTCAGVDGLRSLPATVRVFSPNLREVLPR
ncbi:MAG: kelch repeat-containing protein [bacterium]|nr:kelch repeat-containing protein [bacterium]